jgi:hypothetical protein
MFLSPEMRERAGAGSAPPALFCTAAAGWRTWHGIENTPPDGARDIPASTNTEQHKLREFPASIYHATYQVS